MKALSAYRRLAAENPIVERGTHVCNFLNTSRDFQVALHMWITHMDQVTQEENAQRIAVLSEELEYKFSQILVPLYKAQALEEKAELGNKSNQQKLAAFAKDVNKIKGKAEDSNLNNLTVYKGKDTVPLDTPTKGEGGHATD